ncbi:MAG: bile acid:sodium symporter [Deltaproteobacteria bacterium]|jgi:sodium/bile acid cotransporter 7|nr:bile acid:sodium symporter [Deltaproteobacteria bacterium]
MDQAASQAMGAGFWVSSMRKAFQYLKEHSDGFSNALVLTVLLAVFLPASGQVYGVFKAASGLVVALLFFMHGLKLSPANLWAGLTSWRLHLVITLATFAMFPALGLALRPIVAFLADGQMYLGLLFVCVLPSTVQSSIAFTSIAGGNVAAAVCSASFSSLLGVFVTPVLVSLVLNASVDSSLAQAVADLCLQLVLPFAAGQAMRPWLAAWMGRRRKLLGLTDRLSVLFIVYVSFSHGTTTGIWRTLSVPIFLALVACCGLLLGLALAGTAAAGKLLRFPRADRIVVLFCGSKKSLIAGVPMANIIFSPELASVIILPLMVFHQMQLLACSYISRRLARAPGEPGPGREGASG